jgi:murein DD-endopeptidase MepM/ murein hydrolase activator NlpD
MGKQRFHFNAVTHRYEASRPGLRERLIRYGIPFAIALILSFGIRYSIGRQISNPKESKLLAAKEAILDQYSVVEKKVIELEEELRELQYRDDNIYRSYYELEPISASLRDAGLGGAEQYSNLQGYESSGLMVNLTRRLDMASVKLDVQSNSFKALLSKAEYHRQLLNHKPSIQPISLQNFYWISSVYGYRTDPISKRRAMHRGLDFAGREGLSVYATGDGVVVRTKISSYGFGKEVLVDHGFGYVTRYGHLKDILVETGQELKRGSIIGTLGNTGKSTGPHLHYEVRRYGVPKNPKHYYSEDLSPDEYSAIISQSGPVDN